MTTLKVLNSEDGVRQAVLDVSAGKRILVCGATIETAKSWFFLMKGSSIAGACVDHVSLRNNAVSARGRSADSVYILNHKNLTIDTTMTAAMVGSRGDVYLVI